MTARDPYRYINELDDAAAERLIARLESRARDKVFTKLFEKYAGQLDLPRSARVLDVGCGSGVIVRSLVQRRDFSGQAFGVDHSPLFIDAARRFAQAEGIADRVVFQIGDAHKLEFSDASFDAVIAHTLISHVSEAETVLREIARVLRRGGTFAIFDADYASLTYAFSDHALGRQMDEALANATFNNPRVMRELPHLLWETGFEIIAAWGDVVAEIGNGSYFKTFAETYSPYVSEAGLLPADTVQTWLAVQRRSMENGTFFASCNYYTYLARRA
jgi:ubiquinone/menaquinone biosynthesis C-methylase UbiE